MIDLAREHDLKAEAVERIALECTPQVMSIGSYRQADDGHKARFCPPYSMAVALIDRHAGLPQYTDERVRRADVQALMQKVDVRVPDDFKAHRGQWGDGVNWGEMRLTVRLRDGREVKAARSHARGWPELPASWDDITEKFNECCAGVLPAAQAAEALACIGKLDTTDVRELIGTVRLA